MDFDFLFEFVSQSATNNIPSQYENAKALRIIQETVGADELRFFKELAFVNYRDQLKNDIIPNFCSQIKNEGVDSVTSTVKDLHKIVKWYRERLSCWPNSREVIAEFNELFLSIILWEIDDKVKEIFAQYISKSIQSYLWYKETSSDEDSDFLPEEAKFVNLECDGNITKLSREACSNYNNEHGIHVANQYLRDLGLLHTLVEQPLMRVLGAEMRRYIVRTCGADYEQKWMEERLKDWVERKVMSYIQEIFGCGSETDSSTDDSQKSFSYNFESYDKWKRKLLFILYETYTEMRIEEMFAIITDFPDSAPAIEDLKDCLEKTNLRSKLIESLRNDLSSRVLHRGVSTGDMITMYISAVKALRLLDPSGVVMEIVLEGYMQHLVNRDDTVRCIMGNLLDNEADSDLSAELAQPPSSTPLYSRDLGDSLFLEEVTDKYDDWKPDPREADPTKSDKSHRKSDIISLLINMYGSAEKFISEYQKLLKKRLLSLWCSGIDEDAEIKNLELLKLRFGETDMEKCAVMLKDVSDSRRINAHVAGEIEKMSDKDDSATPADVNALIISAEYWPESDKYDCALPDEIDDALINFNKMYENHKASRSLHWIHSLSRVDIDIELAHETISMKVSPPLASLISLFELKETWTKDELCSELRISESVLKKNIAFWQQRGMLEELSPSTYAFVEDVQNAGHSATADFEDTPSDNEEEVNEAANAKQKQQEAVIWNFIHGMLINLKSLPFERIQRMLKMFATHDPSMKMDEARLKAFLSEKIQKGILCVGGTQYCLNKDR